MPGAQVAPLFVNRDMIVRTIYDRLVAQLERFGDIAAEPVKETVTFRCEHGPFLGAQPQQSILRLSILATTPIESPRIRKCTRVGPGRYYNQVDLAGLGDLDEELMGWIRTALQLVEQQASGQPGAGA